jgi:hypothetical protein
MTLKWLLSKRTNQKARNKISSNHNAWMGHIMVLQVSHSHGICTISHFYDFLEACPLVSIQTNSNTLKLSKLTNFNVIFLVMGVYF